MNYLAHIYLSGDNKELQIGNFIADFIKPKDLNNLPTIQRKGVELHRKIDRFTDTHPEVRKVRELFFEEFRHYSAVLVDVIFDHYLAKNWKFYHPIDLQSFAQSFYQLLLQEKKDLPGRVQRAIPYLIEGDWLSNYANIEGLKSILNQMNNRTKSSTQLQNSILTLKNNYRFIEGQFQLFFAELISYSKNEIELLKVNEIN